MQGRAHSVLSEWSGSKDSRGLSRGAELAFYVYILRCSDNTYYTGYTRDIVQRLEEHNKGKAAKYTSGRRPVELVYSEVHAAKGSAMRREMEIKRWSRAQKQALIDGSVEVVEPLGKTDDG
ncbi:MAG: GIY-YIG nuclease family protein [Actinobacteria bacterium]|nr:MAG: GIY-YIG nuclease family protein [Actinomycetota bacterium]